MPLPENLRGLISPQHELPPFDDWTIAPDFSEILLKHIARSWPYLVVELGSGLSTLLLGYGLQNISGSQLMSLEHDRDYLRQTRERVKQHRLMRVTTLYCPLAPCSFGHERWQWYNISEVQFPRQIDLLIIDGPPGTLQPLSRYPALPMLRRHLSDRAVIMLDDAGRAEESDIVKRWLKENPSFKHTYLPTVKGISVLHRGSFSP